MEVQFSFGNREAESQAISLNHLVRNLLSLFQPIAVKEKSFIINDVPADFYVDTNKELVATILSSLLNSVVRKSCNSCIRISAKRYNNIILLRIRDSNTVLTHMSEFNLQELKPLADKLGGCILADDIRKNISTITLSFRSFADAA